MTTYLYRGQLQSGPFPKKEAAHAYYVWDSEIPGFGLRITPQGSVSYMYKYRNGRGIQGTAGR